MVIFKKLLVCGTRNKIYKEHVFGVLEILTQKQKPDVIIEGCCPNSADAYAEEWANKNNVPLDHYPSTEGNYLKRNLEMIEKCDGVIAFWDGYSYGTCFVIAHAIKSGKRVVIFDIK
jgi:hypothetical protein